MFTHDVSPGDILALQLRADQKTAAETFFQQNYLDCATAGVHPWHASDAQLLLMAHAGIAFATDRTAEILVEESVRQTAVRKRDVMPPDAAAFALGLSNIAKQRMDEVDNLAAGQGTPEFNDDTLRALAAENQLPYWPRTGLERPIAPWQGQQCDPVSLPFLCGIVRAGRELGGHAFHYMNKLAPSRGMPDIPPEYAAMRGVVVDLILHKGETELAAADAALSERDGNFTGHLGETYQSTHDGFIHMMTGYLAAFCPPSLGSNFLPQR